MLERLLAWALAAAIVFMTWGPVSLRPQLGHPHLERLGAYVVLGVVWTLAYPKRPVWVAAGLVLAAIGLEVGQLFIPGRDARVADAVVKSVGAVSGVLLVVLYRSAVPRLGRD